MRNDSNSENYYKKAANAVKFTRYIITAVFIVFILSCIFFFRSDINIENIQYLMKYADFYETSELPDSAAISLAADSDSEIFMLRDNLAVVSRTGIGLYEFSGRKLFNYSLSYSSPGIAHDDRNILVYDIAGNEISIFNSFSRVYTQKFPYSVKNGCINDSGFAIVTNEKTYRSGVIVYNSNYEEVFRWMSADRYVTSVDLADDCSKIVTTSITSKNGSFNTLLSITDIKTGDIIYSCEVQDELALKVGFSGDAMGVCLITDSMLHFYDSKLTVINSFKYNQSKTEKYFIQNGKIVLTEANNLSGNSMSLIGFDFSGNQLFDVSTDSRVSSVACGKTMLYALGTHYIYAYDINADGSLVFRCKIPSDTNAKFILTDSSDRFIAAGTKKAVRGTPEQSISENDI